MTFRYYPQALALTKNGIHRQKFLPLPPLNIQYYKTNIYITEIFLYTTTVKPQANIMSRNQTLFAIIHKEHLKILPIVAAWSSAIIISSTSIVPHFFDCASCFIKCFLYWVHPSVPRTKTIHIVHPRPRSTSESPTAAATTTTITVPVICKDI